MRVDLPGVEQLPCDDPKVVLGRVFLDMWPSRSKHIKHVLSLRFGVEVASTDGDVFASFSVLPEIPLANDLRVVNIHLR